MYHTLLYVECTLTYDHICTQSWRSVSAPGHGKLAHPCRPGFDPGYPSVNVWFQDFLFFRLCSVGFLFLLQREITFFVKAISAHKKEERLLKTTLLLAGKAGQQCTLPQIAFIS